FVDTLAEAFAGSRELFEGLYLEDHWDWNRSYPVLRFDFGRGEAHTSAALEDKIAYQINSQAEALAVLLTEPEIGNRFDQFILRLTAATGQPVVVLIDEYDKPILDNLSDPSLAQALREVLKNFYSVLKGLDAHLKFVLLTGVSKFSKVSLFSGLNNLKDITLDSRVATLCGYTHDELTTTFADYLNGIDLEEMRRWYNGYHFLGESVYNPFDILLYLDSRQFKPYWFETGTPTFLIELLKQRQFAIPTLENYWASEDLLGTFDVETLEPETLLFQTGYLTIHEQLWEFDAYRYRLGYPNHEVRVSLPRAVLNHYVPDLMAKEQTRNRIARALKQDDPATLENAFHAFFASIPHNWYRKNDLASYEGYWASLVYCTFAALGVDTRAEEVSHRGQVDLVIEYQGRIWLLEFKVDEGNNGQTALNQIKHKGYHHRYIGQPVTLIGIDFSAEQRNLSGFAWERA
ncbi:MAG TPA: AAA family ATPase, partial [Candidatus Competibacteraceae bacterium]|nr:AAA family ATPase [Candidatus Competibacteraceae bacterium]